MGNNENPDRAKWGRIFIGTKISELDDVENVRSRAWDAGDENDYLERVKARATEKARIILAEAEGEAADLRLRAREEGYAEGLQRAEIELAETREAMRGGITAVLEAVREESAAVTRAWRDDLAALVRLSVEKALEITLREERARVLEGLYLKAVNALESARRIVVRVNPEDEAAVSDIISLGAAGRPDLESWRVKGDSGLSPGGVIVESDSSLADNSLESRRAAVEAVLAGLYVPPDQD